MSLDPGDIPLLRATRHAFADAPDRTAVCFYAALFREAPDLRHMFPADLSDQGRKLAAMLAFAIDAAGDWDRLGSAYGALARRHLAYGVRRDHHAAVGRALLAALQELGATTAELDAWSRVYAGLSGHMIATGYPEPGPVLERA